MARVAILVFLSCLLSACQQDRGVWVPHTDQGLPVYPGVHWNKVTTPEQLGWSSKQLASARTFARQIGSAAVMIVHRGIVIDAWGDTTRKYRCHSIRKSLLNALLGIQVQAGAITLSHTLADLGIDDNAPSLTAVEKQATVADLLKSRSGVYHPSLYQTAQAKALRPERGSHLPGTHWYYNNWDFNVLGTLFERTAKQSIFAAFKHQIAVPLQMEDYQISDGRYVTGSDSIHPAYPFRMSTRDLARFGLLFLRHGRWRDQRVVPAAWIHESLQPYTQTGHGADRAGYGYMWWVGTISGSEQQALYSALGSGGHAIDILPDLDLVVVHRANTDHLFGWHVWRGNQRELLRQIIRARPKS